MNGARRVRVRTGYIDLVKTRTCTLPYVMLAIKNNTKILLGAGKDADPQVKAPKTKCA